MNTTEMMRILDSIARDRKIERSVLIRDLEQAMVSAARKHYNWTPRSSAASSTRSPAR